jgi:hypothetical protein
MLYPAPRHTFPTPGTADAAGGCLIAQPGRPRPNLRSSRRAWAHHVAAGQPASALPRRLAALYALCGGAHRVTAEAALAAACGREGDAGALARRQADLRLDTLREHVRRLWLDWPRAWTSTGAEGLAALDDAGLAALRACPVLRADAQDAAPGSALAAWVAEHVIDHDPRDWLDRWTADPAAWLSEWSARGATRAARALAACRHDASTLSVSPVPLHAHAHDGEMARLARHLRDDEGFSMAPLWRGHCAETGPWTRLSDPLARLDGTPARLGTVWLRLGARVADLVRGVLARDGQPWLAQGALALAPGEAIAWSEMARGLLIHWVRLDPAEAQDATADPRVEACRVIAPTEWNFHPHGAVAQVLATLPPTVRPCRVHLLAAAFDPCVGLEVERADAATAPRTRSPRA